MRIAFAPPETIIPTVTRISSRPGMGPTVVPWSIGTITVRLVSRLRMRSRRICLPIIARLLLPAHSTLSSLNSQLSLPPPKPPGRYPASRRRKYSNPPRHRKGTSYAHIPLGIAHRFLCCRARLVGGKARPRSSPKKATTSPSNRTSLPRPWTRCSRLGEATLDGYREVFGFSLYPNPNPGDKRFIIVATRGDKMNATADWKSKPAVFRLSMPQIGGIGGPGQLMPWVYSRLAARWRNRWPFSTRPSSTTVSRIISPPTWWTTPPANRRRTRPRH